MGIWDVCFHASVKGDECAPRWGAEYDCFCGGEWVHACGRECAGAVDICVGRVGGVGRSGFTGVTGLRGFHSDLCFLLVLLKHDRVHTSRDRGLLACRPDVSVGSEFLHF